jgi:hypothetical protein
MDQNELQLDPRHLGGPSGVAIKISMLVVHSAQTVHRSSMGAPKTISKPIARSVQTVHLSCVKISTISKETETSFHLTPSPRSSIVYTQIDYRANGMFIPIRAPILR